MAENENMKKDKILFKGEALSPMACKSQFDPRKCQNMTQSTDE